MSEEMKSCFDEMIDHNSIENMETVSKNMEQHTYSNATNFDVSNIDIFQDYIGDLYQEYLVGNLPPITKDDTQKLFDLWFANKLRVDNNVTNECYSTTNTIDTRYEECNDNKRKRVKSTV